MIPTWRIPPDSVQAVSEVLPIHRDPSFGYVVYLDRVTAAVVDSWRVLRDSAGTSMALRTALDELTDQFVVRRGSR